jgi:branched-chain amino acid transport system ATP-binding protein
MLKLSGVSVRYGRREALHDVSFEVRQGELVTLVGGNGAGKTTTLKTISGLLAPNRGQIEFMGRSIAGLPPHRIVSLGIAHVPEGRQLFPGMTVLEHLELGALRANDPGRSFASRIGWVFELFPRLADRRTQRAGTLSGGEQQMMAIGRGLMSAPRFLMLDEPSLGLAPLVIERLAEVFRELHQAGLTILLVEQKVDLALQLANRGYVLETGRIVLEDQAERLLNNPEVQRAYLGV